MIQPVYSKVEIGKLSIDEEDNRAIRMFVEKVKEWDRQSERFCTVEGHSGREQDEEKFRTRTTRFRLVRWTSDRSVSKYTHLVRNEQLTLLITSFRIRLVVQCKLQK